jgi:hypothetical protein
MQDDVDVRIVVAGLSTTCSQKIHNQLVWYSTDVYFDSLFKSVENDDDLSCFID